MQSKLREDNVQLPGLYLDPNNPRFADMGEINRPVQEHRVHEEMVQSRAMTRILDDRFAVQQLQESIASIGFLHMDRLVVVELPQEGKYMVIEGNRRLAAIKSLIRAQESGEIELGPEIMESLATVPVLIIESPDKTTRDHTARILQGVRHVSSVKPWGPYQQAQLIVMMIEEGKEISEIKEVLGLPMRDINRLRRVYYALDQMRRDSDFSEFAKPALFSQIDEALKQPRVRIWLDWDDEQNKCINDEHRHMLYEWFIGPEEEGQRLPPKIVDAKEIRRFPDLIDDPIQFQRFCEDPRLTMQDAARGVVTSESQIDWRGVLHTNLNTLNQIPALDLIQASENDIELLEKLKQLCDELISIVRTRSRE